MGVKVLNLVEARIRRQTQCAKIGHIISKSDENGYRECVKCHLSIQATPPPSSSADRARDF